VRNLLGGNIRHGTLFTQGVAFVGRNQILLPTSDFLNQNILRNEIFWKCANFVLNWRQYTLSIFEIHLVQFLVPRQSKISSFDLKVCVMSKNKVQHFLAATGT
jgi:hypothetical protein